MPAPVNANMKYENEDECNKRDIWVGAGHSPKPAAHSSSLRPSVHHSLTRRAPGTRHHAGWERGAGGGGGERRKEDREGRAEGRGIDRHRDRI